MDLVSQIRDSLSEETLKTLIAGSACHAHEKSAVAGARQAD